MDIDPNMIVEARQGMQSVEMKWSKLAFEHIGAKNPDLHRIAEELLSKGQSEWEGFVSTVMR